MNKRTIKWEKFRNPLLSVSDDGEEEEGNRIMVRSTPFGVEGMKFNPDFPKEKTYIAHTNFDIDEDIFNIVDNIEGVEIVKVWSPYRMRITVGKAFNAKKIRRKIVEKLCDQPARFNFGQEVDAAIYKDTLRLNAENRPWMMYILPNGSFESHSYDNEVQLENDILKYRLIKDTIGGIIISA